MPVMSCTREGKPGYKWGKEGFCFTGSNAEEKAAEVGRAIKAKENDSGHTSKERKKKGKK